MQGRTVTRKTDWFILDEARLQLMPYTQPTMEMAVACSRSPVGAVASGKHGIGMLSIGGTSDEALLAHANELVDPRGGGGQGRQDAGSLEVAHRHLRPRRGDAREGAGRHGVRAGRLLPLLHRRRHLPDRAGRHRRSGRVPDQQRARLHRHAGRLHPAFRAAVAGLRTAASAPSCCSPTTGRTGRRRSAATS